MSLSDWENAKENIVPLKGGRDPSKLTVFANKSNPEELEQEKQKFEELINEYKGEDPIDNWLKYIKWVQQSYPGGNMKEQLIILLERCTRLFINTEKYKNDPRYLRIWITYADMCRDPIEVFAFLENQRIGFYLSLIYEARAIVYENKGDYEKADKAFKQGIERKAQPIERLQQKHQDFERRLMARLKYQREHNPDQFIQQQQQESLLNDENGKSNSRTVLGTISSSHVTSERKSSQIKGAPLGVSQLDKKRKINEKNNNGGGNGGFQIFDDSTGGNGETVQTDSKFFGASRKTGSNPTVNSLGDTLPQVKWNELEPELTKHKENTQLAQKWTDTKIPQKKLKTSSPTFQIYCDENLEQTNGKDHQPASPEKLKLLSNVKQSKLEQIQNNPLANFTNATNQPSSSSNSNVKSSSSSANIKNERVGYNKSLFTGSDNSESSFEEYRAKVFMKKLKEREERERLERERLEREQQERLQKERLQQQHQDPKEDEMSVEYEKDKTPHSPTMTIHTKEAFNDVMAMFSEPLEFEESNKKKSRKKSTIVSTKSPNPFKQQQQQQQHNDEDEIFTSPGSLAVKNGEKNKVTNGDMLMKQLYSNEQQVEHQEPQFITLDQDRERVQTIERIDQIVKAQQQFQIFGDSSTNNNMFSKSFQSNNPNLADKIKGKNNNSSGGFTIFQDPTPTLVNQENQPKKSSGFTIFQDPSPQESNQQQQQQQPKKSSGFAIFQDPAPQESNQQQSKKTGGFAIFQDPIPNEQSENKTVEFEKQQQPQQHQSQQHSNITFSASTFSVSTISPLSSKSMVMMDFNNTTQDNLEASFKSVSNSNNNNQNQNHNITSNITGNITSNIDPTTVIICSLTPDDGIVSPYLIEHQYLLEQHVSGTVQAIETFMNVSDDVSPLPDNFEQVEVYQTFDDNSVTIQMPFFENEISISFSKCIAKSSIDGSTTFKVERIDDNATPEDSWLTCKVQDPSSIWEFYIINQIHSRLEESSCLISKNKFPSTHSLYYYTDKSIMLMDHFDQGTLVDVVSNPTHQMDEPLAMFHTIELLRTIEDLHRAGIIHGNISPKNLYFLFGTTSNWSEWSAECSGAWRSKGFSLTDFSKSIDTTIYSKGAKFNSPLELLPSNTPTEWSNVNKNWCFNLDYLGICKVIFYILTNGKEELVVSNSGSSLSITNLDLVNISTFSEFNSIWKNLLLALLNSNDNSDGSSNILKQQREILENYLTCNQSKSKSIKSSLRIQNIKLFESMKSK